MPRWKVRLIREELEELVREAPGMRFG